MPHDPTFTFDSARELYAELAPKPEASPYQTVHVAQRLLPGATEEDRERIASQLIHNVESEAELDALIRVTHPESPSRIRPIEPDTQASPQPGPQQEDQEAVRKSLVSAGFGAVSRFGVTDPDYDLMTPKAGEAFYVKRSSGAPIEEAIAAAKDVETEIPEPD
jgi:hypothetical protein